MATANDTKTKGVFFIPRASWSTVIYVFILALIVVAVAMSMTDVNHKFLSILTMASIVSLPVIGGAIFGARKSKSV